MIICIFLTTLARFANAEIKDDHRVTSLPGWNFMINFSHYAGYLNVSETRKLSYWLFESQNNPARDPLILWLHGGPGCSSFYGAVMENGPFLLPVGDGERLEFRRNDYAFNKFANVLYLESPAGTGFSINKDSSYIHDDDKTATDNLQFLQQFLMAYPEYNGRDFYIAGISYAGCYVPYLANKIAEPFGQFSLKLKGIILGNPVTSLSLWGKFQLPTLVFNGLQSREVLTDWEKKYCSKGFADFCGEELVNSPQIANKTALNLYDVSRKCYSGKICEGDSMVRYFNQNGVKRALHVENKEWIHCNQNLNYQYCTDTEQLVRRIIQRNVKALYYYGTTDLICSFFEGDFFTRKIGRVGRTMDWYVDGNYAGTKTSYNNKLTYTTIYGAGHSAALTRPKQVMNAVWKFVNDVEDWSR